MLSLQMAKFMGEFFVLNVDRFCLALARKKIHATFTMGILLISEVKQAVLVCVGRWEDGFGGIGLVLSTYGKWGLGKRSG